MANKRFEVKNSQGVFNTGKIIGGKICLSRSSIRGGKKEIKD